MNRIFTLPITTLPVATFPAITPSTPSRLRLLSAFITLLALCLPLGQMRLPSVMSPSLATPPFATLPLAFVPNLGQLEPRVRMQASALGGTLTFAATTVTLTLPTAQGDAPPSIQLTWEGANPQASITGVERLLGLYHSYVGKPAQWRSNIFTYATVLYHNLYPGIDLRYDGQDGVLKGTYIVAPGTDPSLIRWRYQGAQGAD